MGEQQSLQVDDLFPQLGDLCSERVILTAEHFHLGLQVGKPLLLALTTFKGSDTRAS